MRNRLRIFIPSFLALFLFLPAFLLVSAHSTGASFQATDGGYKIEIGYDPDNFEAKQPITFHFSLIDGKSDEDAEFDSIWVKIERGKEVVFATGVDAGLTGEPTLIYEFAESGDYTVSVEYRNDQSIAKASFPIAVEKSQDVQENSNNPQIGMLGALVLGLIVGVAATAILTKKRD